MISQILQTSSILGTILIPLTLLNSNASSFLVRLATLALRSSSSLSWYLPPPKGLVDALDLSEVSVVSQD